jgi:hypothetical protein
MDLERKNKKVKKMEWKEERAREGRRSEKKKTLAVEIINSPSLHISSHSQILRRQH